MHVTKSINNKTDKKTTNLKMWKKTAENKNVQHSSGIRNGNNCLKLIRYCWIKIWHLFCGIRSDFWDLWEKL